MQANLFIRTNNKTEHGGEFAKKRSGRVSRPLATRKQMHLVLRSTQARRDWSFLAGSNKTRVRRIIARFAQKYGIEIFSIATPGNHIHLQFRLTKIQLYRPFIRAVTSAIAMAITGASRLKKLAKKFWDRIPFTRVLTSYTEVQNLQD